MAQRDDNGFGSVIYALVDETGTPRYVGQTTKRLSIRLSQHRSAGCRSERQPGIWLRSCPFATIIPLEVGPADPDLAERRWIQQMREGGVPLLNLYDGGRRSPTGYVVPQEHRERIAKLHKGKSLSPRHRQKLSAAHLGVPLSPEHREAIGRGGRGLPRSPETRARMSAAKMGARNPMSKAKREARKAGGGDAS